jgi:perosamine synthetase
MSNGTCATHCLFLSLKFKFPEINTIYVPNNCYVAAWNAAIMVYEPSQLKVMKMSIETWNIDTSEEYLSSLDKNSAVLIVHNLGNVINVPRLKRIRPDLIFVEDNCEGVFGKYNGIFSGCSEETLCSSVSFYGNKTITTGEGGAFMTQDHDVYQNIKKVYSQGMSNVKYLHDVHAYNYRMTNIQAGLLYDQLNDIDNILLKKKRVFDNYAILLTPLIESGKILLFKKEENTESANWIFSIRIVGNKKSIEETNQYFKNHGIDIRPFFYPIEKHTHLSHFKNNDLVSHILNTEIIMIPSSPNITLDQQKKVVNVIFDFVLLNKNLIAFPINNDNKEILENFICTIKNKHFRYFEKRNIECLLNHKVTLLYRNIETNNIIGYTHIDHFQNYWFGIYIDENYRGKKLGGLILKYTLNRNELNGLHDIWLSVDSDNINAISLYKKNHFVLEKESNNVLYMKRNLHKLI